MKRTILFTFLLAIFTGAIISAAPPQAKGTPRLNVFFMKGFNDAAWQKAAFDKIAKSWVAAGPPAVGKKAVVVATVARDGKLTDSKLNMESGSAEWDKAALEGVRKAAPFSALPKAWTNPTLEVHFHFEFAAK
jgi:TonB family protein